MKRRLSALCLLVIMLFTSCAYPSEKGIFTENSVEQSENTAQFHFIDVGQGDCTLVQSGKTNILIDAGTGESGGVICEYLENLGIKYLDCVILTHPHEDHMGGAKAVLYNVDTKAVYMNGESSNAYFFEKLVDAMLEKKIKPIVPQMNTTYEFGPFEVEFISPLRDYEDTNDNSLITTVKYMNTKALFMADAEKAVEADLVRGSTPIDADILKVGHHGSRYSSSAEFLNAVSPSVTVIQCGEGNSYGHPHKEALARIEKCGGRILRNDTQGTVIIRSDGETLYDASGEAYEKTENAKIEQTYIGNKKSKVFHWDGCPNLPSEKNSVTLSSREEAEKGGYIPCGNCNP